MRAVCYARVSSAGQRERETIASQLRVLPEFVARMGWELVRPVDTYVDDGRSATAGKLEKRTGLAALLRDAALGHFDVVAVVDLDRLSRSERHAERGMIIGALQEAGVRVATSMTGEVLDLDTDHGDLMVSFRGYLAAAESRKKSQRIREGKLQAALRGRKITGRDPYGLRFTRPSSWSLHPEEAAIVRELYERVANGESCYALADDLNARGIPYHGLKGNTRWQRGRLYDLIISRHTVGEYMAHEAQRIILNVPPIVTEELWQKAQDALTANRKTALRKTKHLYLIEGLARCGACGAKIGVRAGYLQKGKWGRPPLYGCLNRFHLRKVNPNYCSAPWLPVEAVDARAWAAICRELEDPELPQALAADRLERAADARDWTRDAEGYRSHLARLDKIAADHLARYRRGILTDKDLDTEMTALRRERAAVSAQLRTAERGRGSTISAQARLQEATATLERFRSVMADATPQERRDIILAVVDPGGIVFKGTDLHVELLLERPASARFDDSAPVAVPLSSPGDESYLRIRLVA